MKQPSKAKSSSKLNAEIQLLQIGGITWDTGPFGLALYARDFARAARCADEPTCFAPARYSLACHSIELGLKAFLTLKGGLTLVDVFDKYKHNLQQLLTDAEQLDLAAMIKLTPEMKAEIRTASNPYAAKVFDYAALPVMVTGFRDRPDFATLLAAADALVDALYIPCRDHANR